MLSRHLEQFKKYCCKNQHLYEILIDNEDIEIEWCSICGAYIIIYKKDDKMYDYSWKVPRITQ